jgi:hypothetical protein
MSTSFLAEGAHPRRVCAALPTGCKHRAVHVISNVLANWVDVRGTLVASLGAVFSDPLLVMPTFPHTPALQRPHLTEGVIFKHIHTRLASIFYFQVLVGAIARITKVI